MNTIIMIDIQVCIYVLFLANLNREGLLFFCTFF